MPIDQRELLLNPYRGTSASHRRFAANMLNWKGMVYLLRSGKKLLVASLNDKCQEAARQVAPGAPFCIGVVVHPISTNSFHMVHLHRHDAEAMAADFEGFLRATEEQLIVAAHRAITDYLIDAALEGLESGRLFASAISDRSLNDLKSRRIRPGELIVLYCKFGVPPISTSDLAKSRLHALTALRNLLEHNDGVVNETFLSVVASDRFKLGQRVELSGLDIAIAIGTAETTAREVDQFLFDPPCVGQPAFPC